MKKEIILILFCSIFIVIVRGSNLSCNCDYFEDIARLQCDNILSLINVTGGVNPSLYLYDLQDVGMYGHAHLSQLILMQEEDEIIGCKVVGKYKDGIQCYRYMLSFYEVIEKKPQAFAKSLMQDFIFQDTNDLNPMLQREMYGVAGWEYLRGIIFPKDTILGKYYLSLSSGVPIDSLENYILPFWRDTKYMKIYQHKHDSIIKMYGVEWEHPYSTAVIKSGDTLAYKELMNLDVLHLDINGYHIDEYVVDLELIYAIYMIDQYNYLPAYKDLYRCLKRYKACHHKDGPLGKFVMRWLCKILIRNYFYVPTDLWKDIITEMSLVEPNKS